MLTRTVLPGDVLTRRVAPKPTVILSPSTKLVRPWIFPERMVGSAANPARKTKFVYIDTDTHEVEIESYNKDFKTERRDLEYAHNYIQVIGKVIDISGDPNAQ